MPIVCRIWRNAKCLGVRCGFKFHFFRTFFFFGWLIFMELIEIIVSSFKVISRFALYFSLEIYLYFFDMFTWSSKSNYDEKIKNDPMLWYQLNLCFAKSCWLQKKCYTQFKSQLCFWFFGFPFHSTFAISSLKLEGKKQKINV